MRLILEADWEINVIGSTVITKWCFEAKNSNGLKQLSTLIGSTTSSWMSKGVRDLFALTNGRLTNQVCSWQNIDLHAGTSILPRTDWSVIGRSRRPVSVQYNSWYLFGVSRNSVYYNNTQFILNLLNMNKISINMAKYFSQRARQAKIKLFCTV